MNLRVIATAACVLVSFSAEAQTPATGAARLIPNHYIVVLNETGDPHTLAQEARIVHQGVVNHVYDGAVHGFSARLTPAAVAALARDPQVRYIENDQLVWITQTQSSPQWGLDRIDQRQLPLNSQYNYPAAKGTVYVHVIDTGVRPTHSEFGGRAFIAGDFVDDDKDGDPADVGNDDANPSIPDGADCNGHGTHVSGTVAGAMFGVAKNAVILSYRALDCSGSGTMSAVIAAVDRVTADTRRPAVANMSLGGGISATLDAAVQRSIDAGITYVVAAGNANTDASLSSPARVPAAITVAASTSTDARASFSNYGAVVDLFAPGVSIPSAWFTSDTAATTLSGTSMAAPHVAGAAALYLDQQGNQTPAQVAQALVNNGTVGVISNTNGSPNVLLFTGILTAAPPPPPPSSPTLSASPSSIQNGQSSTLTLTCPTTDCHNVFINGVRPTGAQTVNGQLVMTLMVTPTATTTYTSSMTTAANQPWPSASTTVTVTAPPPPSPPAAPTNLNAGAVSATQITLSWTDNASTEQGFTIQRCTGASCTGFTDLASVGANVTAYSDTTASAGTTYQYQLRAFNAGGNSAYSNVAQATTPAPTAPPASPTITANPSSIRTGQSSTLTVTCPSTDCHNVFINGVRPTSYQTINGQLVMSLAVQPTTTTSYTVTSTKANGTPWPSASVTVTVTP
jgi:aqualysin 1